MGSKLGGHFMAGGDPARWVEVGARVFKFTPEVLGASLLVPAGPLVVGKLDQEDAALGLTDWKALQRRGVSPQAAADIRFNAQRNIFVGNNKPRLDRYAANPRVDVWEDDNEVVPDDAAEADWYADYCIEMMRLYDSIGKKRANFSFAVGTPDIRPGHGDDIWPRLLPAVRYARDHGHYIALHEYMGYAADFGVGWRQVSAEREPVEYWHGRYYPKGSAQAEEPDEGYPYGWAALRYRFIYDLYFRPAGLGDVKLLITEAGCDSVESVTPAGVSVGTWKEHAGHWRAEGDEPEERYAAMLGWYDDRLREDSFVAGATIFTVGHVGIWANWDIAGTGVEARVLGRINMLAGDDDPVVVPPVTPPAPPSTPPTEGANMLVNPSFEEGHYDLYNAAGERLPIQVPNGWAFKFDVWPGAVNPIEPEVAHSRFGQPECNVLHRYKFPESEWAQFGLDGDYIFKWFGKAHRGRLQQVIGELAAGEYEVRFPLFVDAVMGYAGGAKVWADDLFACNVRVRVNERDVPLFEQLGPWPFEQGALTEWWYQLAAGRRHVVAGRFVHPGGACKIALQVMMPFALPANGVFVDDVGLARVGPEVPPPSPPEPPPTTAKHKAIVVKLPQDVAAGEWLEAAEYAYEFRHTMTASHDDMLTLLAGGNRESYVKLCWPGRQADVAELIDQAGYRWEPLFDEPESPLEGLKLGHVFAYRYVLTSPFDAPRGYGNKLHEGADYDIVGGAADNKVDVLCLFDGVVERSVDSAGGYGKYVRVRHERNGATFFTRYAHLDARYVAVGQTIQKGVPVGEVGATGNVSGEHVHVNLEVPGFGRSGYVVADVVDPAPFIPSGAGLPLYQVAAPPTAGGFDLLPYLRGDGRAYMVQHPGGPSEKFRTVDLGGGRFLQLKNSQWEEFWVEGGFIWRGTDTSASEDTYYRQWESGREGARWCAARMAVGQTWTAPVNHMVQTYRKRDCGPVEHHRNGVATNRVTLVARLAAMTWNGVTVKDVIHLRTHTGESMWFGRGIGLVAWDSDWGVSAIAEELRAGEGDNEAERGCFGP